MSLVSHTFFGHWLTDACSTALLAGPDHPARLEARDDWPDTADYARAFGFATYPGTPCRMGELHLYTDHGQGASKRARYAELKTRLRRHYGVDGECSGQPVYLRRGRTGVSRETADEDAVMRALSLRGFAIVDLQDMDLAQRYRQLAQAPVVVSMDGSHVIHALFAMPQGAGLIALIPADRFTMVLRGYASAMNIGFGCVVAEPSAQGYVVNADDIMRTIDLLG